MYMTQGHFIYSLLAYAIIVKMLKDGNVFDTGHFIYLPHAYAIITKILLGEMAMYLTRGHSHLFAARICNNYQNFMRWQCI